MQGGLDVNGDHVGSGPDEGLAWRSGSSIIRWLIHREAASLRTAAGHSRRR